MGAVRFLPLVALVASACTTVTLGRLDRCTVERSSHLGNVHERIVYCDDGPPAWSDDRAVRLTQECLHHARQNHLDALMRTPASGTEASTQDGALEQCYPAAIHAMQGENEALKDRVARTDEARAKLEAGHSRLEDALAKALDRPVNAVADASSHSDSGSDSQHHSEALTHFTGEAAGPAQLVKHDESRQGRVVRVTKPAVPAPPKRCTEKCPEPEKPAAPSGT